MTKFIKLTECNGNEIIINVDCIEHITKGSKGTDTYIKMLSHKENYFFVKESVDDIWVALNIRQAITYDIDYENKRAT